MQFLISLLLFLTSHVLFAVSLNNEFCSNGIKCSTIEANDLKFDCRMGGNSTSASKLPVLLIHGFPYFSSMYEDLMRALAKDDRFSVACDMRGYSPGASPDNVEDYHYDLLREDVFALVEAFNFNQGFHLIGHDLGSALGWYTLAENRTNVTIQSFVSLSVPHLDAFTSGLYGENADYDQQIASQYFTVFVLKDSASKFFGLLYTVLSNNNFETISDFQKAVWWYNGFFSSYAGDGIGMGMVRTIGPIELLLTSNYIVLFMRLLYGIYGGLRSDGVAPTNKIGSIENVPILFICGLKDPAILCDRDYSKATINYVNESTYEYLAVDCGHDLLACGNAAATDTVKNKIRDYLTKYE